MKKICLSSILACLILFSADAQVDTSALVVALSGYAETYYGYDVNQPADASRPGFIYSHNRHNEFNVNLAYLKAAVSSQRIRGNVALMAGTYANANLAAEPATLRHIYEANAGVKISKRRDLWVDAGIFGSHIGFESAVGKDCWTLTRSILADNSPYYEAGAKLTYTTANGKWLISGLLLNGWQRVQRVAGNSALSGGWQIQYKPSGSVTLNSSSFIGTDKPDDARRRRVFHNLYGIFQVTRPFGLIIGLDTGWEEGYKGQETQAWYSPVLIGKYAFNNRTALAVRAEYYSDKNGVIISTGTQNGFQTLGLSAGLDVQLHKNALWRIEGKMFSSKDAVFLKDNDLKNSNAAVTTALAVWF